MISLYCVLFLCIYGCQGRQTWAVEFQAGEVAKISEIEKTFNVVYEGTVGVLEHVHLFSLHTTQKRSVAQAFEQYLQGNTEKREFSLLTPVKWYEEQIPRKREKRSVAKFTKRAKLNITDPLWEKQWHLHGKPGTHLNTEGAWELGFMGQGIRIAIVDDGIQSTHPDVRDNVRPGLESSYNFNGEKPSPDPTYMKGAMGDWHGTASAGAAAARDDGQTCGVGAAPRAELAGIAILQNNADVPDSIEAKALAYMYDKNHIYSNSWGPILPGSHGHQNEAPGPLAQAVMEKAIAEGRLGLGSVYVWAAGNDGRSQDNCNYDGYANMRFAVLVGSVDENGIKPSYSEPCAALACVTPGGSISNPQAKIYTTDLLGSDGLDNSDCTVFAGTSASCPQAAGIIALILSANPSLSWLDVQYVIAQSSKKHNDDEGWIQNGAGYWVSHRYGWGLMDAKEAVILAQQFTHKIEEISVNFTNSENALVGGSGAVSEISVGKSFKLHHVEVKLWTSHNDVAGTTVTLKSPAGTVSVLAEEHRDKLSKWQGWRFLSRLHFGEDCKGTWTLTVKGGNGDDKIQKWELYLFGDKSTSIEGASARSANPPANLPVNPPANLPVNPPTNPPTNPPSNPPENPVESTQIPSSTLTVSIQSHRTIRDHSALASVTLAITVTVLIVVFFIVYKLYRNN